MRQPASCCGATAARARRGQSSSTNRTAAAPFTGIRSLDTAAGRIKVLKRYFGELPVKALEEPAVINRFKSESDYARNVEIATMHKVLATLRAAMRWGQAQTPPLVEKLLFHRFGVRLNQKAETVRDRRISRDEEKRLLDAAIAMNRWEHRWVGPLMHDRIIGARELCCRRGEMALIQNPFQRLAGHAL
jgi:hypothetical protein